MGPIRGVVQMARMLAWGASGRRFESCLPDRESEAKEGGVDWTRSLPRLSRKAGSPVSPTKDNTSKKPTNNLWVFQQKSSF